MISKLVKKIDELIEALGKKLGITPTPVSVPVRVDFRVKRASHYQH